MERVKLAVIDNGLSNIGSLVNMLRRIGADFSVVNTPDAVMEAGKIILPGIGAFDAGMKRLNDLGLIDALNKKVLSEKIPALGICLGMQMMSQGSEEGTLGGLSWFDARVVRFKFPPDAPQKIPHMGWNFISQKKQSRLFGNFPEHPKFYFVHSYHFQPNHRDDVLCMTAYGYEFASAVERDNIAGVQFHPEKSHKFGMQLLKNFVEHF